MKPDYREILNNNKEEQESIPVGCVLPACQTFVLCPPDVSTGGEGVGPRMNKFEQVSSHGHQMPLARGPVPFLISGLINKMYIMSKCIEV